MPTYLATIARYQAVMRDIDTLMQGIDVNCDLIDANAMFEINKEVIDQKYKRKSKDKTLLENIELEQERRKEVTELMQRKSF